MSKHFPLDNEPINRHHGRDRDGSGCMPRQCAVASALNTGRVCQSYR